MKMSVIPASLSGGRIELQIEHNEQVLLWNVASFDKRCFTTDYDVCKHVNEFWSKLPYHRQEKIFELFSSIRMIFEEASETAQLIQDLLPKIKALYDEHPIEEIGHWIAFYSNDIIIPETFVEQYIPSDERPGTREKTYTKPDYRQLVALAMSLRIMIPIWGEFIYRTKDETGTNFKEYYAFQLLTQTNIMQSAPMEKLKIYVESNIQTDKSMASAIIGGVGSQDYASWLLGLVLVRRLCVGNLGGLNQMTNLVTFIYNYISQKVNGNNNTSFGEMIKSKQFESPDSSNEHNTSRIEGYKIKQESPIGDMVILDHFMEDYVSVALLLKPDINLDLLHRFMNHAEVLQNEQIWQPQIILTQWLLKPVISPRGITHLSKKKTISAIAIAQTVLWEKGHKELACLISAMASSSANELQLSGIDSRARIPKEQMDEISTLYPYSRVLSTKQKTKPTNPAVAAIDSVASMLSQRDWILTVPDEQAAAVTGNKSQRRYSCPYDIKVLLSKLVIETAKRI